MTTDVMDESGLASEKVFFHTNLNTYALMPLSALFKFTFYIAR